MLLHPDRLLPADLAVRHSARSAHDQQCDHHLNEEEAHEIAPVFA